MEPLHLDDYIPFILNTCLLFVGSLLITSGVNIQQYPMIFVLVPLSHIQIIGGILIIESIILGGYWCYTYFQKVTFDKAEGGYLCPRCQTLCHPDALRCSFCNRILDLPFENQFLHPDQIYPVRDAMGVCCVCGDSGNYYRNGRWFCFSHRDMGR